MKLREYLISHWFRWTMLGVLITLDGLQMVALRTNTRIREAMVSEVDDLTAASQSLHVARQKVDSSLAALQARSKEVEAIGQEDLALKAELERQIARFKQLNAHPSTLCPAPSFTVPGIRVGQ